MNIPTRLAIAACIFTLTGCDGLLSFSGRVVRPDGKPASHTAVYLFVDEKPDRFSPVLWTDESGRFELHHMDCPCDFPVELIATHSDYGIGRYATTHKVLEKERRERKGAAPEIIVQLTERPTEPMPPLRKTCPPPARPSSANDSQAQCSAQEPIPAI